MKRIVLTLCVFIALTICIGGLISPTNAKAGEIYTYTDENGKLIISNAPLPEKYEKKAKKTASYTRDSAADLQRYEAGQKAKEQAQEDRARQNQQTNEAKQAAQSQRNQASAKSSAAEKSRVDLEEKRLEGQRDAFRKFKGGENDLDAAKEKLKKDPDQYFYNKEQSEKAAAAAAAAGSGNQKSDSDFLPKVGKYRWQVE